MQIQNFSANQIDNLIDQQVENILKKKMDELLKQLQKQAANKMTLIKAEIYGSFTSIVKRTFVNVFNAYYGTHYNVQSLLDSINFNNGNGLIPDFSYNKNKFMFDQELDAEDLTDRHNRFNKNAGLTDEFVRFQDPRWGRNSSRYHDKDLYNAYKEQLEIARNTTEDYESGDSGITVDEYNESLDFIEYLDSTRGKPANNMLRPQWYEGLDKVYKKARTEALRRFDYEFNVEIKPRVLKKYGINISK